MSNLILPTQPDYSRPHRLTGLFTAALLALALGGCTSTDSGGRYSMEHDAPPDDGIFLDPNNIPDAVPIDEPRTAAGNKSPYTVLGDTYEVMPESDGYEETGKASWYGKKFHGHKTSNGEIYSMYKMSGAHRTLPIPSYVRVTNLANGRTGIVRINDRGPFHSDRIIDLSYAAAVKLDIVRTGTAQVKLEAISPSTTAYAARQADSDSLRPPPGKETRRAVPPPPPIQQEPVLAVEDDEPQLTPVTRPSGSKYLQAGAFRNQDSALALRDKLADLTGKPVNVDSLQGFYKVRIGPLSDQDDVHALSNLLVLNNYAKPQVVYF